MIGLDTNVLVRFLTQDDPVQSKAANRLIEQADKQGEALFINQIVLCELIWVLGRAYRFPKAVLVGTLEKILLAKQFEIGGKDQVWQALAQYESGTADFSDCLIGTINAHAGCGTTVSFDRATQSLKTFKKP